MHVWLNLFRRTRREYFADFFITPPITLALLVVSLLHSFSVLWPLQFLAGVVAWTLYEYAMHRWILHHAPFFKEMHALHHDHQRDYIAVHPLVTIALYAILWAIFGVGSSAITVGFSIAYIVYSCLHTAFHYAQIGPDNWLYRLKMDHVAHHRGDGCFGVSTSLVDRLLGTYRTSR
jgi:sterol desaturase/sphingolipid hydroxylase (fatty acid hydroxylase superfamily)